MAAKKKKIEDLELEIVYQKPSDLIPYVNNAKLHPDEQVNQIAASIREFGFLAPILIDGENGIVAGHGRLMASFKLKLKKVPTIEISHLTDPQKKAYIIADNKLTMNSDYDMEVLGNEMHFLNDLDFDLSLTGFGDDELAELFLNADDLGSMEGEDDVPEPPETPVSKLGDVWQLGDHRLMCGDSTDAGTVALLMDGKKAELLFTSPPYSDMRDYNGGKDLDVNHLIKFIPSFYEYAEYQVINLGIQRKDNEVVEYWQDYIKEAKKAGYKFLSWNIWDRDNAGSIAHATAMFMIVHEWIFVFGKNRKDLIRNIPNDMEGYKQRHGEDLLKEGSVRGMRQKDGSIKRNKTKSYTHHQMETIIRQTPELGKIRELHPATFPVDLPIQHIEAMTKKDDYIIDPFGGSGSTLIACEKTKRNCYMMELDPVYTDVIIQGWEKFTGKEAVHIESGKTYGELKKVL